MKTLTCLILLSCPAHALAPPGFTELNDYQELYGKKGSFELGITINGNGHYSEFDRGWKRLIHEAAKEIDRSN